MRCCTEGRHHLNEILEFTCPYSAAGSGSLQDSSRHLRSHSLPPLCKILTHTLTFEYLLALEALKTEVFLDALVHVRSHRALGDQGPLRGGTALIYQRLILIREAPIMAASAQSGRMQWGPLNPAEKIFDCGQKIRN